MRNKLSYQFISAVLRIVFLGQKKLTKQAVLVGRSVQSADFTMKALRFIVIPVVSLVQSEFAAFLLLQLRHSRSY